jgi:hypothetical protein
MKHIKIVVSGPDGSGRSLIANTVLSTFRTAGFQSGLKDLAPDNLTLVPRTFTMDTMVVVETAKDVPVDPDVEAKKAADLATGKSLLLLAELIAALSKVALPTDEGHLGTLKRVVTERNEAQAKLKEKEDGSK